MFDRFLDIWFFVSPLLSFSCFVEEIIPLSFVCFRLLGGEGLCGRVCRLAGRDE